MAAILSRNPVFILSDDHSHLGSDLQASSSAMSIYQHYTGHRDEEDR